MTKMLLEEVRSTFVEFFEAHDHQHVSSSPLVPDNDPTLLFTNAGMVQFKGVFTGQETRDYHRAVTSQKCVRAGGKHNDLDNVGYTARHHTFFEMLGNFSFGDYFKDQAISHAWELITQRFGLPKDKLLVTVYADDDEAFQLWQKIAGLPEQRIIRIGTSDNFWSMGETGPCGPCSEIFFDHGDHIWGGPPGSPEEDGDRFVEIWNLVFMQYEQQEGGQRIDLPRPSIDTGMGLERVSAVLQNVHDNYDIDLFRHLISASKDVTGADEEGEHAVSHRVIADHLRSTCFMMADGVTPSNEGRGYVLRRIMRRALRHAHKLGAKGHVMSQLVPALLDQMGRAFPELERARGLLVDSLYQEEDRFRVMLDKGMHLLEGELDKMGGRKTLSGDVAFRLYDTFGFPLDLTQDALRERGMNVDVDGFEQAMEQQRETARASWSGSGDKALAHVWTDIHEEKGDSHFVGYERDHAESVVAGIIVDGNRTDIINEGDEADIILRTTPFYAESGGQQGDHGKLTADNMLFEVTDCVKPVAGLHVHRGRLAEGRLHVGQNVHAAIDVARRNGLRRHHSATHLLHESLRRVLGDHVAQKGSLVSPNRLRFDFTHANSLTGDEMREVESLVLQAILDNQAVSTEVMTPDEAVNAGALALFGEKYGDEVRVLAMGPREENRKAFSVELCGGTHVSAVGDIGMLKIVSQSAVSAGVRRVEAVVGDTALHYLQQLEDRLGDAALELKSSGDELVERIKSLVQERRDLDRQVQELRKQVALAGTARTNQPHEEEIAGMPCFIAIYDGIPAKELRGLVDEEKKRIGEGIIVVMSRDDGKVAVAAGVTKTLQERVSAVDLVREAALALGGKGGGGRPDMAQAGGPDVTAAEDAASRLRRWIAEK